MTSPKAATGRSIRSKTARHAQNPGIDRRSQVSGRPARLDCVPEGRMRIAKCFSIGLACPKTVQSRRDGRAARHFSRPSGTRSFRLDHPTLKRWAILGHPCGMKSKSARHGQSLINLCLNPAIRTQSWRSGLIRSFMLCFITKLLVWFGLAFYRNKEAASPL